MAAKIADFIMDHRGGVLLFILSLSLFFLFQAKSFRIYHDLSDISAIGHPNTELQKKMDYIFGGANLVTIGMIVEEGDIFNPETIAKLYRITQKLKALRGVVPYRIASVASRKYKNVFITHDPDGTEVLNVVSFEQLAEDVVAGKPQSLNAFKEATLKNDLVMGPMVSRDKKGTIILADFQWDRDYQYIFQNIQEIVREEEDANTRFHIGGRPIEQAYLHLHVQRIVYAFSLALLIILVILFGFFRTKWGMILPILTALLDVVWTLGIMSLLKVPVDVMTTMVPFLILSMSVCHAVQIMKRYYEHYEKFRDNQAACRETIRVLLRPAPAIIATDALGFGTLFIFPFRMIRSLAIAGFVSNFSVFFTSLCLHPILLSYFPPPTRGELERQREIGWLGRLLRKSTEISLGRGRWFIFAATLLILSIGLLGIKKIEVGDLQEGAPNFWEGAKYNQDLSILNRKFPGVEPLYIYIGGKEGDITDPLLLKDIDALEEYLRKRPEVGYVHSYIDILKKMNLVWQGKNEVPDSRPLAAQYLEMFVGGGGDPEATRSYFTMDWSEANIQVLMRDHKTTTIKNILNDIHAFLKEDRQSKGVVIEPRGGLIGIYAGIIEEIERNHMWSIILVTAVNFFFCALVFRSLVAGMVAIVPLIIGTTFTFGIMGYWEIGFFLPTVPVAALGMGIGVDFGVYVLSRLKEELRGRQEVPEAYPQALGSSGKAVFFAASAVAVGVLSLITTGLRFQSLMGGLLALILIASMMAALIVLPAVVSWARPKFLLKS